MASDEADDLVLEQVDDSLLDEDDLHDVLTELVEVENRWKFIGIALRLKSSKIKAIEEENRGKPASCFMDVLSNWLNKSYNTAKFGSPSWRKIVKAVACPTGGDNAVLAKSIATKHQLVQPLPAEPSDSKDVSILESLRNDLNSHLQSLTKMPSNRDKLEESKILLVRGAIQDFIERGVQSKIDKSEIKKCLTDIYGAELLFSKEVYEWAMEMVASIPQVSSHASPESSEEEQDNEKPLFCEDTVYHASLCCYAVSTRDANNYKDFFIQDYPSHLFEEVSLSISRDRENVDRYLIAKKGNVYFIAFKSEINFSQWTKEFKSFEQGISIQTSRIPLRFLIKLLHDGCQIVCTGYSFGGTLALSVTASLWNLPLINPDILERNLCCITFSPPLLELDTVNEIIMGSPRINSTLHSIIIKDDFIPRLTMFLDPKNEEICSEAVLESKEYTPPSSIKGFQGILASNLLHHIGAIQNFSEDVGYESDKSLNAVKMLLQITWPHLLANRVKADDYNPLPCGCVHLIDVNVSEGLFWDTLLKSQVTEKVNFITSEEIDNLKASSLFNNDMNKYHNKIVKSFVKSIPSPSTKPPSELMIIKPIIFSVSFHRYGKEFAITISGENMWFCNQVQVGTLKQPIGAENVSQKSLQFNCNLEDKQSFKSTDDQTRVKLWSHFSSPVTNQETPVKHKVYLFTFRQEQLAKLTPSELIKTAYLSALLEQQPHSMDTRSHGFSHRFETLRTFLMKVVTVVPFESLIHAISVAEDKTIAEQCCRQVMTCSTLEQLSPSLTLITSLNYALEQMLCDILEEKRVVQRKPRNVKEAKSRLKHTLSLFGGKYYKDAKRHISSAATNPILKVIEKSAVAFNYLTPDKMFVLSYYMVSPELESPFDTVELKFLSSFYYSALAASGSPRNLNAVCGTTLEHAYPLNIDKSTKCPLNSPLNILIEGRKRMQWLVKKSSDDIIEDNKNQRLTLSELYNSKMLETVNEIRRNELEVCSLLIGAFMEEQIRVPLMRTSFDTARAIEIATSAAAVGVWALFSLTLGDVQALIRAIPSQSLLVDVTEYIKGVFKQNTVTADEKYAGKLQFMVQGMNETVSCNSHYVSYSLERQLIELCKTLKIDETTPLETLITNWDEIFKDNVMSLVVQTHRSLIARWLKWALMIHQLREELARYTAVGVVGLVNSGKSLLVSTLFNVKIPVGTSAVKRTTVPFLYSMDGVIDGLDVIDFPGVDDRDKTISDLAELLLAIAQVVVFVVDYRKAHTESAKKWLELLEDKSVPVLVCLTYADKLYAENMGKDGSYPDPLKIKKKISDETHMMLEQLGNIPSRTIQFYSFSQDRDSILNSKDGRQRLQDAGIRTPQDVGDWLAKIFEEQLDQDELAEELRALVHRPSPGNE